MLTVEDLAYFLATSSAQSGLRKVAMATPLMAGLAGAGVGGLGAGGMDLVSGDVNKRRKARTRALTGAAAGGLLGAAGGAVYDTAGKLTGSQPINPIPADTQAASKLDGSILPGPAALMAGLGLGTAGAGIRHVRQNTSNEGTVDGFRKSLLEGLDLKAGTKPSLSFDGAVHYAIGGRTNEDTEKMMQRIRAGAAGEYANSEPRLAQKLKQALNAADQLPDARQMYDPRNLPFIGKNFKNKIPIGLIKTLGGLGAAGIGTAYGAQILGNAMYE